MKISKKLAGMLLLVGCFLGLILLVSCSGKGEQVAADNCVICHNEETTVLAKNIQWHNSLHGSGDAYLRSTNPSCAGCHSSEGFVSMLAAGQNFSEVKEGVTNPTMPNCRTCHQIHNQYTEEDWALTTRDAVQFVTTGGTFDKGAGNICADCHQPRLAPPAIGSGEVNVNSNRWGPHHGVQGTSLIGVGGYGVDGNPGVHYSSIKDSCVTCHMEDGRHEMEPSVNVCISCHQGLNDFDLNGVQTEVKSLVAELKGLLEDNGLLENDLAVPGTYPEAQAGALWNYLGVVEDGSFGVHNPDYIRDLLQTSIGAFKTD